MRETKISCYIKRQSLYLSQRYIPNNVTLKKRTVCILRPVPAFGWAPVINELYFRIRERVEDKERVSIDQSIILDYLCQS